MRPSTPLGPALVIAPVGILMLGISLAGGETDPWNAYAKICALATALLTGASIALKIRERRQPARGAEPSEA